MSDDLTDEAAVENADQRIADLQEELERLSGDYGMLMEENALKEAQLAWKGASVPNCFGWQPIASVPKNGAPVMVWVPMAKDADGLMFTSVWREGKMDMPEGDGRQPTHWMYLPAPPESVTVQ